MLRFGAAWRLGCGLGLAGNGNTEHWVKSRGAVLRSVGKRGRVMRVELRVGEKRDPCWPGSRHTLQAGGTGAGAGAGGGGGRRVPRLFPVRRGTKRKRKRCVLAGQTETDPRESATVTYCNLAYKLLVTVSQHPTLTSISPGQAHRETEYRSDPIRSDPQ